MHATANCNGYLDSLCTLQQKQLVLVPGCDILSLEIQAVALASLYLGHLHSIFPNSGL